MPTPVYGRTIYVSSSLGHDTNFDGKYPYPVSMTEGPKKTIQAGYNALVALGANVGRQLLLKAGDTFSDPQGDFISNWTLSGANTADPMVFGSYDADPPMGPLSQQPRPKILSAVTALYSYHTGSPPGIRNLLITGIHFEWNPSGTPTTGIYILSGPNEWVRIEDCYVTRWASGIGFDPTDPAPISSYRASNISVRRCVVVDNYRSDGPFNDNGLYVEETDGLLIEECVFDANGWNVLENTFSERTPLDHNIYVQANCTDVTVKGNISARGGADNYQLRSLGKIHKNLSLKAPIHFSMNGHDTDTYQPGNIVPPRQVEIWGNVALEGDDINPTDPNLLRGWAYHLKNVYPPSSPQSNMRYNIAMHKGNDGKNAVGINLDGGRDNGSWLGISNFVMHHNVVLDWSSPPDPSTMFYMATMNNLPAGWPGFSNFLLHSNHIQEPPVAPPVPTQTIAFAGPNTHAVTGWSSYDNKFWTRKQDPVTSARTFMGWFSSGPPFFERVVNDQSGGTGWRQQTGVVDALAPNPPVASVDQQVSWAQQARTIDTYHQSLPWSGGTGGLLEFMAECRLQRKGYWRPELTGIVAVEYFQAVFWILPLP